MAQVPREVVQVGHEVAVGEHPEMDAPVVRDDRHVHFGLLADRDLVPDLDDFARHLGQAVADYKQAATPRKRKVSSARRAARPRKKPAQKPVDLRVDDEPVVAAPNGDRGDVRSDAAAEVHDVV